MVCRPPAELAGDVTIGVSSPTDLAGDVTVGEVAPSADLAEVSSSADLAGDVITGVASSAVAEVASSADIAEVVSSAIAEVASSAVAEVASSAVLAEAASSAEFAGEVTVGVTSLADPARVVTAGVAFQEECEVPSGLVCDYDDYFDDEHDYDDPGDFDTYPCVHGFVAPDNYELYHDLHGLHDCGVYCVSRGGVDVVPYWSGDEEGDVYEGDVALSRAGSDKPVDWLGYSVISTFGPGGPRGPCVEEGDVCEGNVALSRTGSDEPVNSVVSTSGPGGPGGPCDEEGDAYEGDVAMHRTGSDETVNSVVSTISLGGPSDETGSGADAIVTLSECRDCDRGTLDNIRMWRVKPRSESKVCCEPSHSIIFDEGVFTFDLCPPGMMCKLDCPWVSPYLFVSLGKWFVTNREQPVLTDIRRHCWKPGGTHSTVGFPQECTPAMCRDSRQSLTMN